MFHRIHLTACSRHDIAVFGANQQSLTHCSQEATLYLLYCICKGDVVIMIQQLLDLKLHT
jgi:hypothetical protein